MLSSTCIAPVNIAVIKYWGKRNEELILPLNDSISSTLSVDYMSAKTSAVASPKFEENRFWLNGKEESFDNPRLLKCLEAVKSMVEERFQKLTKYKVHIWSENNFPTAAGLASSAAGYAAVVSALANMYTGTTGDLSIPARLGSGSACRSVLGGWVQWHAGSSEDGSDSVATQIAPASHWPDMRIVILVVNDQRKKYSSTSGMKQSVDTSEFLKYRTKNIVPKRIVQMKQAIQEKDFETFATLTMQDSNQFHSVCLDTFPPCVYMNDVSHAIVELVHAFNSYCGYTTVAYTFDAGPNACLYMMQNDVPEFIALVKKYFPPDCDDAEYIRGLHVGAYILSERLNDSVKLQKHDPGTLKYIIHTKVGNGPKILDENLFDESGLPIKLV